MPKRPPWNEALEAKLHIVGYYESEHGRQQMVEELKEGKGGHFKLHLEGPYGDPLPHWYFEQAGHEIAEINAESVRRSTPYWVEPDMMDLAIHAAQTFPNRPLHEHDLLTRRGLVMFSKPWLSLPHYKNMRGEVDDSALDIYVDGATWELRNIGFYSGGSGPGVAIVLWMKNNAARKYWVAQQLHGADPERFPDLDWSELPPLIPVHVAAWGFGVDYVKEQELREEYLKETGAWGPDHENSNYVDIRAFMHTLFTLFQQRIALISGLNPPRYVHRQNERLAKEKLHDSTVQVVKLRKAQTRSSYDELEHGAVTWSHRWIVDGHWRNQWYPSLNEHRTIWIAPHVKGPDDMPLIIKDKVYSLER